MSKKIFCVSGYVAVRYYYCDDYGDDGDDGLLDDFDNEQDFSFFVRAENLELAINSVYEHYKNISDPYGEVYDACYVNGLEVSEDQLSVVDMKNIMEV